MCAPLVRNLFAIAKFLFTFVLKEQVVEDLWTRTTNNCSKTTQKTRESHD